MECNKEEAMRAKSLAVKKMIKNDFEGGRKFALKAQKLFPQLENISHMLAVCDVHCAAAVKTKIHQKDLYGILQVQSFADVPTIKKHYRKLALVLHPDKNLFPGAESAFKLIAEAHIILSDYAKRTLYDSRHNMQNVKVDPQRAEPSFSHCTDAGVKECSKRFRKRSNAEDDALPDCSPKQRFRDKQHKEPPTDADLKEDDDSKPPVYVDVPDLEFSNFDKDKEEECFAVDQFWAVYDTIDSMPRFYAQIRKVYSCGFRLRITWLEADPENLLERNWAEEGLPVVCGKFKLGASEETNDRLMFSHQMAVEKGRKRFSFVVYPKKGEIWALFKNWDMIKWTSDSENHMKYNFEIVEILSDFDEDNGVVVGYMVKVKGFVSLFQKAQVDEFRVPPSDLFRFSHNIPSLKLSGSERANVPVGSFELDTASLPDDLEPTSTSRLIIHDFTLDKQNWVFEVGQIWALGRRSQNADLKCYAQIKKIESGPLRLHVDLLELCSDTVRPYACGLYKTVSVDGRKIFHQDSFLYHVKAQVNGRNRFNIYPRKNEIWALCKQHDGDGHDIVEVVENNGDAIEVLFLTCVGGYKSVFKSHSDRVVIGESDRFLYRVPAVCLTDGDLRGFWELDLAEFPELVPS